MALTAIHLENFLVFKNIDMTPVKGINILLGKNGTGKTQLLKIIYGIMSSMEGPPAKILLECFKHGMTEKGFKSAAQKGNVIVELCDDQLSMGKKYYDTFVGEHKYGEDLDSNESLLELTQFNGAKKIVYIPVKDMLTVVTNLRCQ